MRRKMFKTTVVLAMVFIAVIIGLTTAQAQEKLSLDDQLKQAQARQNQAAIDAGYAQRQIMEDAEQLGAHKAAYNDAVKRIQQAQAEIAALTKKMETPAKKETSEKPKESKPTKKE